MNRRGFLKALGLAPVAAALPAVVAAAPAEMAAEPILSADPNVTSTQVLRGDATWEPISLGYVKVRVNGVERYLPCL